jgi:hypothetical protein
MTDDDIDIRTAASIPGRPTMLDHVLLVAMSCEIDPELRRLADWIKYTYLGSQTEHAARQGLEHRWARSSHGGQMPARPARSGVRAGRASMPHS